MSGLYREAFHELAQDAFEELKKLGEALVEAAVVKAQEPEPTPAPGHLSLINFDTWPMLVRTFLEYHPKPWDLIDVKRLEDDAETIIYVRLPCRHVGSFLVDDTDFARVAFDRPAAFYDFIIDTLDGEPGRRCYCIQHEAPGPCTSGVCK